MASAGDSRPMTNAEAVVNMFAKSYGGRRSQSQLAAPSACSMSEDHSSESDPSLCMRDLVVFLIDVSYFRQSVHR